MTQTIDRPENPFNAAPANVAEPQFRRGGNDLLLQELWTVKAAMNAAAGYCVGKRAAHSRAFDLDETLARLRRQVAH